MKMSHIEDNHYQDLMAAVGVFRKTECYRSDTDRQRARKNAVRILATQSCCTQQRTLEIILQKFKRVRHDTVGER